ADVLKIIAEHHGNILTIHQSIPIGGIANLSISIQILPTTGDVEKMLAIINEQRGVRKIKVAAERVENI
ncbi:MAG: hypothetical protein FWC09_08865, partial [Lachnospiraceae bacterium]|nr:hypothetical protein [Lachnospiraceae bacterium]